MCTCVCAPPRDGCMHTYAYLQINDLIKERNLYMHASVHTKTCLHVCLHVYMYFCVYSIIYIYMYACMNLLVVHIAYIAYTLHICRYF